MKSKIKKILVSIQIFFLGIISKVSATSVLEIQTDYGIEEEPVFTPISTLIIGKFILPVILFVIGLIVVISNKITKKVKMIIISSLIILGVLAWTIF